jgi:putative effector of murein hydrolase LrgA (UPF0299 family)
MRMLRDVIDTLRSAPWFALGLLIALAAAGFNGLMVAFMVLGLQAFLPGPFAQMGHFTEPHHRIHDLTFAFLFVPAIVGVLAQLRRPARNIAAMWTALVPSAALVLTLLLTLAVGGNVRVLQPPWLTVAAGALMATALHPAGGALSRAFRVSRLSWPLLVLTLIAAAPLLAFAAANVGLQSTAGDEHAAAGHYGFMAAFSFTVIGTGILASLRPVGWPVAAWLTGLLPALLGASSLIYPDASSSLPPLWALAAVAWGTGYLVAAEVLRRRADATEVVSPTESADLADATAGSRAPASAKPRVPGWAKVAGVIVGVVILVLVGIALMAGGGHGPEQFGPDGLGPPLWTARL